jgi:hypothetical protein
MTGANISPESSKTLKASKFVTIDPYGPSTRAISMGNSPLERMRKREMAFE